MVRTLREEATSLEKSEFLRQLLPMQSGNNHDNVISLIGVALDAPTYLAVLEFCQGDLKTFLCNARGLCYNDQGISRTCLLKNHGIDYFQVILAVTILLADFKVV